MFSPRMPEIVPRHASDIHLAPQDDNDVIGIDILDETTLDSALAETLTKRLPVIQAEILDEDGKSPDSDSDSAVVAVPQDDDGSEPHMLGTGKVEGPKRSSTPSDADTERRKDDTDGFETDFMSDAHTMLTLPDIPIDVNVNTSSQGVLLQDVDTEREIRRSSLPSASSSSSDDEKVRRTIRREKPAPAEVPDATKEEDAEDAIGGIEDVVPMAPISHDRSMDRAVVGSSRRRRQRVPSDEKSLGKFFSTVYFGF